MDPPLTSDGKPYGVTRYKDIVQERYIISKFTNTSYTDLAKVSPLERKYLLGFVKEEIDKNKQAIEERKRKNKSSK